MYSSLADIESLVSPNLKNEDIKKLCEKAYRHPGYKSFVKSIAKRYINLDCSYTLEDLMNESIIALYQALQRYKPGSNMKFSTYLYWMLQKHFSGLIKTCIHNAIQVEIYDHNNQYVKTLPYNEFIKIKKHMPINYSYIIKRTLIEDVEPNQRREKNA